MGVRAVKDFRFKLQAMEKLFEAEGGDLWVSYFDYPPDLINRRWPHVFFWTKHYTLSDVLAWLEANNHTHGKIFLYGRFFADDIQKVVTWASRYPELDLVVAWQSEGGPREIVTLS